jgi:CheY-like chemotaxis protein
VDAPAARPAPVSPLPRPAETADGPAGGRVIVIVEDQNDARAMLRAALELHGHIVKEARDGPAGLEAIRRLTPDVAFVDLGLPGFDGFELARRVRAAGIPTILVALTGYSQPADRARTAEAGFDRHLVKPVDPLVVLELVAQVNRGVRF